jgi:hypothetical protein
MVMIILNNNLIIEFGANLREQLQTFFLLIANILIRVLFSSFGTLYLFVLYD